MSRLLTRWVAISVLAAALGLVAWSGPAQAANSPKPDLKGAGRVTFGLQPATRGSIDDRPSYRYGVTPGATLTDQVAVRNLSATPVTFQVYATDAFNIDNGDVGFLPRAQRALDVGRWLTVGGRGSGVSVRVRARGTVVLPLTLRVPTDAQPGDHTGGVIVSLATRSKDKGGANVILDQRVASRVFVRVSGPQRPALAITPVTASYQSTWNPFGRGRSTISYTVTNTGNINLGGRQRVVVRGLFGPSQQSSKVVDLGLLLPRGSARFTTTVPQTLPVIHERALISLSPLVQAGDQVTGLRTYTGTGAFWAVPWTLLGLVLVLGLTGWLVGRGRRGRRRSTATGATGAPVGLAERRARRLGAAASLAIASIVTFPAAAHAADTPYTDTAATGGITLCDSGGRSIRSGSTGIALAATVVAGGAAQAPYDGRTAAAGLFAFQPRRGALPGEWSGQGLTALSRYTNTAHPAVEILPRDTTLRSYLDGYPAMWDGLVQLRIYLRTAGAPTNTSAYSATSLKVTGGRWVQVGPAAGDVCGTSTPTSVVRLLGLPTTAPRLATSVSGPLAPDQPSAQPSTPAARTDRDATTPSAGTTSATTSASSPGSAAGVSSIGATASPVDPASSSNGVSRWPVVVAMALLIALAAWFVSGKWGARDSS